MYQEIDGKLDKILKNYPFSRLLVVDSSSAMSEFIDNRIHKHHKIYVKLILDAREIPIAWAWSFHQVSTYNKSRSVGFMIYVASNHRRKGIGRTLFGWGKSRTRKLRRTMVAFPWDSASDTFFAELDENLCTGYDDEYYV